MVQLFFLGSGGTRKTMYYQYRRTAGFLILSGSEQVHVDPGPGSLSAARDYEIDLTKTTAIFASHHHLDNCADLNVCIDAISGGKRRFGHLFCNKKVFDQSLTNYHRSLLDNISVLKDGDVAKVRQLSFKATPTKFHDFAIGFVLTTPNSKIGYTSDTAYSSRLEKVFKGVDTLIINTQDPFGSSHRAKFSSDDALSLISAVRPKLSILNHYGPEMIMAAPLQEARRIQKLTGLQVVAASDGALIDTKSYDANTHQKTLF